MSLFLYLAYKIYKCFQNRTNSRCCIQIFNQCNTKKLVKHNSKMTSSIEMTEISTSEDDKSVKSLPNSVTNYHSTRNLKNY